MKFTIVIPAPPAWLVIWARSMLRVWTEETRRTRCSGLVDAPPDWTDEPTQVRLGLTQVESGGLWLASSGDWWEIKFKGDGGLRLTYSGRRYGQIRFPLFVLRWLLARCPGDWMIRSSQESWLPWSTRDTAAADLDRWPIERSLLAEPGIYADWLEDQGWGREVEEVRGLLSGKVISEEVSDDNCQFEQWLDAR